MKFGYLVNWTLREFKQLGGAKTWEKLGSEPINITKIMTSHKWRISDHVDLIDNNSKAFDDIMRDRNFVDVDDDEGFDNPRGDNLTV